MPALCSSATECPSVLHVVAPAVVGGLEAVVRALAVGAGASAVRASVVAILPGGSPDHPFVASLAAAGVDVFPVCPSPRAYWAERSHVAALCRRLRPDVVHTHGYRADVVDAGVARRQGARTVTTVHGFTGGGRRNHFYEWLQRRAMRHFDAVVAVSRPLARQLEAAGVPAARIHVLQNAWHDATPRLDRATARRLLGVADSAVHVGWAGRISGEKGLDVLIDALALLRDLPLHVSIFGDGPDRVALEQRVCFLGLGERVHWLGTVPAAVRLFAALDGFVLSSRTEGTPIALLEAMAACVPIVATAVGGVPDVVSRREALLVEPEDREGLAGALRELCRDPVAARVRARAAAARLAADFALGPWLARYGALYRALARPPAAAAS